LKFDILVSTVVNIEFQMIGFETTFRDMSNLNRRRKFGFNEAKEVYFGVEEDDEDFDRTVHLHPEDPEVRLG
jgi:hypothetical protein